ncbi:MAG: hypothetical protein OES84_00080 [Kiritimatiellaceae bacterium]|nr:hypothetical protein [Kiritimatiellaceae bacterium]
MATSGSYDFTVTRDGLIKFALRKIGVLARGQTAKAEDILDAAFALNLIIKQWQDRSDGAPSIKMWLRKRLVLFLQDSQYEYHVGPSAADHCADEDDLLETTTTAAASSGASTLTLASVSDVADTNYIGLYQDNGVIHWTTVDGAPAGNVVTLTDVTSYAAASGNAVYVYSTKVQPPLYILTRYYRNENGDDWEVGDLNLQGYDAIADKDELGTPAAFYYEKQLDEGVFYLDSAAEDARDQIRMTVHYPAQDVDLSNENIDFPAVWYRALGYMLAVDLAPEYEVPITNDLMTLTTDAALIARNSDPETSDLFFQSEA